MQLSGLWRRRCILSGEGMIFVDIWYDIETPFCTQPMPYRA